MNRTTDNTTLLSCGVAFFPLNPARISPVLHTVFIFGIVLHALTCPLIILLNFLVMVAVKTKRQLRTKSNVVLACLATTDLVVGLAVQPLHIASASLSLKREFNLFCTLIDVSKMITAKCVVASLNHLLLMSAERYFAIKHPFGYENQVTEVRILIASGLAWAAAIFLPMEDVLVTKTHSVSKFAVFILTLPVFFFFPAIIYFNGTVYKEVRRSEKQIAANQVSLEAKEKIIKNKKAFYTTAIVLLAIFLCHILVNICFAFLASFKNRIPAIVGHVVIYLLTLLLILNSLFNPLIYAVRIRYFRIAFIQLLSRKTFTQAEELERKIFGPRQIGIIANVEQGHNGAGQEENEQQENKTLNNGNFTTVQTEPQEEYVETPL